MNTRQELGNACLHKPRVHRLKTERDGADESITDEKVNNTNSWIESLVEPHDDIIETDPRG